MNGILDSELKTNSWAFRLYLLREGKSVLSNGVTVGISTTPGHSSCLGVIDQHAMVTVFLYAFISDT